MRERKGKKKAGIEPPILGLEVWSSTTSPPSPPGQLEPIKVMSPPHHYKLNNLGGEKAGGEKGGWRVGLYLTTETLNKEDSLI